MTPVHWLQVLRLSPAAPSVPVIKLHLLLIQHWFDLPKLTLASTKRLGSQHVQLQQWSDLPLTLHTLTYQGVRGRAILALDSVAWPGVGNGWLIDWWQYQSSPQSQSSLASPGHSQNTLWLCVCVLHMCRCVCVKSTSHPKVQDRMNVSDDSTTFTGKALCFSLQYD